MLGDVPTWVWIGLALAVGYMLGRGAAPSEAKEVARASAGANLARLSSSARANAEAALDRKEFIAAVKIIRADLGSGLRDAKLVADAIVAQRKSLG